MTKRYILPTWEEFSKTGRGRFVDEVEYKKIHKATAVEDGRSPLATDALVRFAKDLLQQQNRETLATLKTDDTVTISIAAPQFVHLWYLAHGEESPLTPLIEESERLVGKARGEAGLGWKDVFGPKPGETWADVGGGEEKPVRGPDPAANKPRCVSCVFWVQKDNDVGECHRFPSKVTKYGYDWCGEWRAK